MASPRIQTLLLLGATLLFSSLSFAQKELKADLDPFIQLPGAYGLTPADLETMFEKGSWSRNPYLEWLATDQSRAIFQKKDTPNLKVELSLLGGTVPIEELIVDFKDGKFLGVTISIFNRGDGGTISASEFEERKMAIGRHLGQHLATRPVTRESKPTQGLLSYGGSWIAARGKAVLEPACCRDTAVG